MQGSSADHEKLRLRTTVNGARHTLEVRPDEAALEVVRERLGLTGNKLCCGDGSCGACTMLLDGEPHVTCLLPATSLEGRELRSIEGLGDELHPVQRAFMACDALQCGFCTCGFVMGATAFFERWRRDRGTERPAPEAVAEALAGHLCRCGSYPHVVNAVQAACAGEYDADVEPPAPRQDARAKVTGAARYTVDVALDGQLEGCLVRSPHAHARVRRIDATRAASMAGVAGVHSLVPRGTVVRYVGQAVAAVAAVDGDTARRAAERVEVSWEVRAAVLDLETASRPGAPRVYRGFRGLLEKWRAPNSSELPRLPAWWRGNVRGPFGGILFSIWPWKARHRLRRLRRQDGAAVVEATFTTQAQIHTPFEPHACVAHWEDARHLTVYLSTQGCYDVAGDIARRFGLRRRDVRLLCPFVGGAFGCKQELGTEAVAAIELARLTGRPVRVVLDRDEELAVGGLRSGVEMQVSLGGRKARPLEALELRSRADSGIATGSNVASLYRVSYDCPVSCREHDVVSFGPPGKPFRGPGGPPALWALEQVIDQLAHDTGSDPLELRRRSDSNPIRQRLYDWAGELELWRERPPVAADRGRFRRGVGLAASTWIYFCQSDVRVRLDASSDDGVAVSTSSQDMGNGTATVLARAAAEVLGIDHDAIEVRIGDSQAPRGPTSSGSRTTTSVAPAAADAARQLRDALLETAHGLELRDVRPTPGGVEHSGGFLSWSELLDHSGPLSFLGRRRRDAGGWLLPFKIPELGLNVGRGFTGGVQVTEVEVDTRLGRIRARESWGAFAAGRIVAPVLAHSQALGGFIQGLGYALYEERMRDPESGLVLSANLQDYQLAGIGDMPDFHLHFEEIGFENATGGAVGLSELTTLATAASIGNAVFHATGWRPRHLPLRPDRVLAGLGR